MDGEVTRKGQTAQGQLALGAREEHVGGLEALALTVVQVEDEVILGDEVARVEAKLAGSLVDGVRRAFEFDEGADGGFVEVNQEIFGPFEACGEFVGSAEFFVAEPAAEAEAFEDFLESGSVSKGGLEFFADLVAAVRRRSGGADGELFGRRFEGEQVALGGGFAGFSGGELLPFCFCGGRGGFGTDAEELTVFGQATVGGVEDEVAFVDAGGDGFGTEFRESAEEGFGVGDVEFDFDLGRHK